MSKDKVVAEAEVQKDPFHFPYYQSEYQIGHWPYIEVSVKSPWPVGTKVKVTIERAKTE